MWTAELLLQKLYRSVESNDECPICYEPLRRGGRSMRINNMNGLTRTWCNHYFHKDCLNLYLSTRATNAEKKCPLCRRRITDIGILVLLDIPPTSRIKDDKSLKEICNKISLPAGWNLDQSAYQAPYETYVQWEGPPESSQETNEILDNYFENLLRRQVINRYTIHFDNEKSVSYDF